MYRDGDNLVILTKFKKNFTTKKTITSTLIDYFTNAKAGKVLGPYPFDKNDSAYTSKNKNYVYDSMLAVKTFEKESAKFDAIIGNSKNNTYNLKYTGGDRIYEDKGNETYNITHAYVDGESTTIYEYAGKDKYDISGGAKANILEYAGNDKYILAKSSGNLYEYAGNDTYNLGNDVQLIIADRAGKDSYTLKDVTVTAVPTNMITDDKGNDKYSFENVKGSSTNEFTVHDLEGKDKYTIKGTNGSNSNKSLEIIDGQPGLNATVSGYDTYNISNANYAKITDYGGNNKFTLDMARNISITTSGAGKEASNNDKFTIKNSSGIEITSYMDGYTNESDNDTYTVSGTAPKKKKEAMYSSDVVIQDNHTKSSDTYNFSYYVEGDDFSVSDQGGSDKYNITNCGIINIRDYQETKDAAAKSPYKNTFNIKNTTDFRIATGYNTPGHNNYATVDTYNITSSFGSVWDYSKENASNDTYKINKLTNQGRGTGTNDPTHVNILDAGGEKDVLTIGANKNDLVFMTDGGKSTYLYIYDKKNHGYAAIQNFFGTNAESYVDDSAYRIETIKAGKTNVTGNIMSAAEMNDSTLQSQVAGWLSEHNYDYMVDALDDAANIDASAMNQLIGYFTKQA